MLSSLYTKLNNIKNHQGFIRYFKNTSWLFVEKIFRIITGLFVGIWVARYLGPEQFGLFSYAQSFVALFAVIATVGLDSLLVREMTKHPQKMNILMGTAFILKIAGALITLLLLALSIGFTSNDSYTNTLIFIIASATIFQSLNVIDYYFQSQVLSKYVVYANTIMLLISSIIKITLIVFEASLIFFVYTVVIDSIVLAVGLLYCYLKKNQYVITWQFNRLIALSLLKNSWSLIVSGVAITIFIKIDQIMIKEMLNTELVGQYAAATKLTEIWYFIPLVISASIFPAIINAKKQSMHLYHLRLQRMYALMTIIAIAIALPTSLLSDWIINLLFGAQYNEASNILSIYIWASIFVFFGTARSKWIIIENLQNIALCYLLLGCLINIVANLLLIPSMGIKGAAIATLISQISIALVLPLTHSKTRISVYMFFKSFNIKSITDSP